MAQNLEETGVRQLILAFVCQAALWAAAPKLVWIDTDPSAMPGGHEVDDVLALLQAFGSPEITIRGVSIVFGNAELPTASRIGKEIVSKFGPPSLPVFVGASDAAHLGRETDASRGLAGALRRERLTVLALGPATNIATVVRNHPELAGSIEEVVAVAGRRPGQRFTAGPKQSRPFRDLNFELDPEAFRILLAANIPTTLAPWEISSKVWIARDDIKALSERSPGLRRLLPAIQDWLALWENNFGARGFNPFDTLAIAYVVSPRHITCSKMAVVIKNDMDDARSEAHVQKPFLLVQPARQSGRTVNYCHTPAPGFKDDLLRRLATNPH